VYILYTSGPRRFDMTHSFRFSPNPHSSHNYGIEVHITFLAPIYIMVLFKQIVIYSMLEMRIKNAGKKMLHGGLDLMISNAHKYWNLFALVIFKYLY
jgi:hypothetical protein